MEGRDTQRVMGMRLPGRKKSAPHQHTSRTVENEAGDEAEDADQRALAWVVLRGRVPRSEVPVLRRGVDGPVAKVEAAAQSRTVCSAVSSTVGSAVCIKPYNGQCSVQ